ncbi:MAG: extracellular solute-binding protein [Candidatus Poribacteria bacterium]|nr:extracellular solute-binding protein [Candidatus Poribacteria bacterium]
MTRRDFLQRSALAGLGVMTGCMRRPSSEVIFKGWPYEPDLVRENIEYFEHQTNIKVDYQAVSGNYHDKMVALFVGKTPMDCCYVRDDDFVEWIEAGWIRPYEGLPGAEQYGDDMFDYNLEAMSYEGNRYGLPYYVDFTIWVYNAQMLESAGFEQPARTLDELTEQAIKIKERRVRNPDGDVVEYPIMLGFRQVVTGFTDWWALNYASEVDLFDDDLNPIFPDDEDRRAEQILQWITDGIHKHGIIDVNSLTSPLILNNVSAGRQTFALINKHDLERVNSREDSAVAEAYLRARGIPETQSHYAKVIKMAPVPSLEPDQQGTLGWTRMYCLTAHCREEYLLDAWKLVQFLGGKDASGDYYTARHWFRLRGLGFAFKSLLDDPEIIAQTEQWGDSKLIKKLSHVARIRENIRAPWFPDFNLYYQPEIQKILLRQQSPRDGLARIAKRCRELKREWT